MPEWQIIITMINIITITTNNNENDNKNNDHCDKTILGEQTSDSN